MEEHVKHRLATLGDSLTMGFVNGAVYNTRLAYPAMLAEALGTEERFRTPVFDNDDGTIGGLPLNLETLLRILDIKYQGKLPRRRIPTIFWDINSHIDRVERHWEHAEIHPDRVCHNLAVLSHTVQDSYRLCRDLCQNAIPEPRNHFFFLRQLPEMPVYRATLATLCRHMPAGSQVSNLGALAEDGGIENVIIGLGANNCLGAIIEMKITFSSEADMYRSPHERTCNLWLPDHFEQCVHELAKRLQKLRIGRTFVMTVPTVTIPPISRGCGSKDDTHYEYYTRPWIWDSAFDPDKHAHLTRRQVRLIDEFVQEYNLAIRRIAQRFGWHIIDLDALFRSLAFRRSGGNPSYTWPRKAVEALRANPSTSYLAQTEDLRLDTRYIRLWDGNVQKTGIKCGGLFGLDGVHPTTICYGLVAEWILDHLRDHGVRRPDGGIPELNWSRIVEGDTLVTNPPSVLRDLRRALTVLSSKTTGSALFQLLERFKSNV